jgi:hypothetical protein
MGLCAQAVEVSPCSWCLYQFVFQDAAYGRNQNEQVVSYFHAMFVKKAGATKRVLVRLPTNIETKEVFGSPEGTSR